MDFFFFILICVYLYQSVSYYWAVGDVLARFLRQPELFNEGDFGPASGVLAGDGARPKVAHGNPALLFGDLVLAYQALALSVG
jgi:hypothetical protein